MSREDTRCWCGACADCLAEYAAPRREDAGDEKPIDYLHPLEMHHARREDAAGERVTRIAARLKAATPGPWEWQGKRLNGGPANAVGVVSHGAAWDVSKPDAEFIAHSRSDMEYLLAALSTAEREREALHQQLGSAIDVARETMTEITVGRIASIGSIGSTYCPQIRVSRIEQLHERLVALADSYRARVPSGGEAKA